MSDATRDPSALSGAQPSVAESWLPPVEVEAFGLPYVSKDWRGLMQILRDVYPADIFTGTSGDLGPRLVALLREIDEVWHA